MATNLQLEFIFNRADVKEALSLWKRDKLDPQADWERKCFTALFPIVVLVVVQYYVRKYPVPAVAVLAAILIAGIVLVVLVRKSNRRATPQSIKIEVSETDIVVSNSHSRVVYEWPTFGDRLEFQNLFVFADHKNRPVLVIPKRAFPDQGSLEWFRDRAVTTPKNSAPVSNGNPVASTGVPLDKISLTLDMRFRDYLVCALVSLTTWGLCLFIIVIIHVTSLLRIPTNSPLDDFGFLVMVYLVGVICCIISSALRCKRWADNNAAYQKVVVTDECVASYNSENVAAIPWAQLGRWLETPWNFILWRRGFWMILPKRAFASRNDVDRCRALLGFRSKRSRCFFGS